MSTRNNYADSRDLTVDFTIASGQSESAQLDCMGMTLIGLIMPATLTNTSFNFKASAIDENAAGGGASFKDVYNESGGQLAVIVSTDSFVLWNVNDLKGLRFIKLAGASNEGAERTFTAILRG